MEKLFIEDLNLKGKKVLLRVDFNVPLNEDGTVADSTRILASLPTIRYVLRQGGALILLSHLGRPHGTYCPSLSLSSIAKILASLLQLNVEMASDCIGEEVRRQVAALTPSHILLLENLRFHRAEEHPETNPSFAEQLASYGDLYINDAFAVSHRKHSSIYILPSYFPGKAAAGFLLKQEITALEQMLLSPQRPFVALLGGAKISTKIGIIQSLLRKVDRLIIGGGMAYTFLKAQKYLIGHSLIEENFISLAKQLLNEHGEKIVLPVDSIAACNDKREDMFKTFSFNPGILEGYRGMDIGPKSIELFCHALACAKTILWNGPLGVYEIPAFAKGTYSVAQFLAQLSARKIVGGGDLIAAIKDAGVSDKMTFISTGGGATLEFIELGTLPSIEALSDSPTCSFDG